MWLTQVLAVLSVIERVIPVVEKFLPGPGKGEEKATIVKGAAVAVAQTVLPGVPLQEDPAFQALLKAKIDADVALANALQKAAQTHVPGLSTVANLDTPPAP